MCAAQITVLDLGDIEDIITLLYQVYGYAYVNKWMYERELLHAAIKTKQCIFVGAKISDKLISMLCISFSNSFNTVVEVLTWCTNPCYQNHNSPFVISKLFSFAKQLINKMAKSGSVCVILTKPITKHLLTQKLQANSKLIPVGLTYCTMPDEKDLQRLLARNDFQSEVYHNSSIKRNDQVITVFCYPYKIQNINVCLPSKFYNLVCDLFSDSEITIMNKKYQQIKGDNHKPHLKIQENRSYVRIGISQGNVNIKDIFKKIEEFIEQKYRVIHVNLNVGQHNQLNIIEELQNMGFVYAGLIPSYYGIEGHALVLQFLNGCKTRLKSSMLMDKKIQLLHSKLTKESGVIL